MTFETDIAGSLADLYDHAGVAAVFTPIAGGPQGVQIIVENSVEWEPQAQLQIADDHVVIHYQRSEIDRRVVKGETFVVGVFTYTVRSMAVYPGAYDDHQGQCIVIKS